jgi:hypothetical protein
MAARPADNGLGLYSKYDPICSQFFRPPKLGKMLSGIYSAQASAHQHIERKKSIEASRTVSSFYSMPAEERAQREVLISDVCSAVVLACFYLV